jgi:putative peptide zinc metalloprotease protein
MGESKWVVKNPETLTLYTFTDAEWGLVSLFDGSREPSEIRDAYNAAHPGDLIEHTLVLDYEENLKKMTLLAQSGQERSMAVMQRLRDARKLKAEEKEKKFNIFLMLFPIADPNVFLARTVKYVRWLWYPEVVAVGFVLFGLTAAVFVRDFHKIWAQTVELYSFLGKPVTDVLQFYLIITLIAAFHELGRLSDEDLRRRRPSIGLALFFFLPAYFTDTTDSELFEQVAASLGTMGGIYIELYICVLATALWVVSYPDTFIHDIAYKGMIYTGVSTVFFNVNPLTPTDGYHALADMMEIPELRPESFHYIGMLIQKYIFRLPVDVPVLSKRKRRIFLIYGPLSIIYTGSIMLAIFALINHIYGKFLGELATPLAILTALRMFRKRLRKFTDVLRMAYLDKKEYLMSRKVLPRIAAGAAVVLLALIIPWPHETLEVPVRLGPASTVQIAAPADATIASVGVREGQRIAAGPLARLAGARSKVAPGACRPAERIRAREASRRPRFVSRRGIGGLRFPGRAWLRSARARPCGPSSSVHRSRERSDAAAPRTSPVPPWPRAPSLSRSATCARCASRSPVTERLLKSIRVGEPLAIHVQSFPFRTFPDEDFRHRVRRRDPPAHVAPERRVRPARRTPSIHRGRVRTTATALSSRE